MGRVGDLMRRGMLAPFRALLPKNPWMRALVYALPVVLLLALFSPALDVVVKLVELVLRVIEPLLHTTLGRVVLLLLVFALGGAFVVWLLQHRVRDMRAEAVLGRHLQAVAALVGHDVRRSRELLRKVARYRGAPPLRYPHVVADANLKLARLALDGGRLDEALGWLARVIEPGLPDELLRSLLQLRVRAWRRQGELLPGALRGEVERAVERFPDDPVLLGEWRDLVQETGDPAAIAAAQEKVHQHAPPAAAGRERQRWIEALVVAGRAALAAGDRDGARKVARKLARADQDGPSSGLLLGDVHRAAGEFRQAIKAWGATRSPLGLDRVAELLTEHPGAIEPRELLESCPLQGTLLLVARELARIGESARAERAARLAAEALGPTATVCAVLAEVLELLGRDAKARLLREQTVARLLAAPVAAPAPAAPPAT
jgi:tetratricopeptide (TPR) repeat protein